MRAVPDHSSAAGQRRCERCRRPLSRYNKGSFCQGCVSSGRPDQDGDRQRTLASSPQEAGARLRRLRLQRALSLEVLAGLAGVSAAFLSMVENGRRELNSVATVTGIAAALDVPPSDLLPELAPAACPGPSGHEDITARPGERAGGQFQEFAGEFLPDTTSEPDSAMDALADDGFRAVVQDMLGQHRPSSLSAGDVPPEIVSQFRAQLDRHYRADLLLGPHQLIAAVAGEFGLLGHLAGIAAGGLRADLLRMGTAYAGFMTWLYQDAGNHHHALLWGHETLDLAHRAQDLQLVSHALVNKAMLFTDLGSANRAIDLSEAALGPAAALCAKVRVQAMQQAAHGYSLAGDRRRVDELLDGAFGLISVVDDDYPWGNACRRSPVYIEAQRATCYGRLGLTGQADQLWGQVAAELPSGSRRDKGVYLARHAGVLADAGRLEHAAALVRQAAPLAAEIRSARMRQELLATWRLVGSRQSTAAGRDIAGALAGAGIEVNRAKGS
jgi:transcriptional regulator with XRE-family HTH domain